MKKLFLSLFLSFVALSLSAIEYGSLYINMKDPFTGYVDARFSTKNHNSQRTWQGSYDRKDDGQIINELVGEGWIIDKIVGFSSTNVMILMYKNDSANIITQSSYSVNNDKVEIKRYNIQGMDVDENYDGVQIIVYSDYSTNVILK